MGLEYLEHRVLADQEIGRSGQYRYCVGRGRKPPLLMCCAHREGERLWIETDFARETLTNIRIPGTSNAAMWNECYPSGLLPVGTRETGPGTVTLGATRGGAWRRGKSSSTGCGESSGIPRRRFGHSRERSGGNYGYGIETRREIVGARQCVRDADIDSPLAARRLRQQ